MFQFPGCPPTSLFDSARGDGALPPPGFPIRISMDQSPACGSPWLNAACHVLLRQSVPWHSPCALICLIFCRPSPSALRFPLRSLSMFRLPVQAPGRSDHEVIMLVDTQPLRFRCSLILSLCFPCAVFKMRIRTVGLITPAILQNDTACEIRTVDSLRFDLSSPASDVLHPFLCRSARFRLRSDRPRIWRCVSSSMSP